ncbi:MAG TPA: hypothetical protein VFE55_13215 [Acidimicrobiia bacterium]|nr:hypothetical protein [Acidimicrobiia bacterium]
MTDAAVPALTLPAAVVNALLEGEVVIDVRVQPDAGGPPAGATRFWLRADSDAEPELKPAYREARRLSLPDEGAGPGRVRVDGWAELRGSATAVVDADTAEGLNGKTVLALEPLAGREVLVLALRAHRLVEPQTAPDDLAGLPADPADGPPSEPALSEAAFDARRLGVENALPTPLKPPA